MLRSIPRALFLLLLGSVVCGGSSLNAAEFPKFEPKEIDAKAGEICYAVVTTDVDGDKKPDVVVVTENRVLWYQNPDWKRREIIADQTERDNVCIAPFDIDGDGKIDFGLGAGWLNGKNLGTLYWVTRGASLDEKWKVHSIGSESWTHRMKWGDFLGTGKPQLIVSPLNKSVAPQGVRVLALEIPEKPTTGPWKFTVLDDVQNAMHNHWVGDFDGDGRTDMITAGMEGVFLIQQSAEKKTVKTQIGEGMPGPNEPQKKGAGEIKVGKFKNGKRFVVTVEPMHGKAVAVYSEPAAGSGLWTRHVLDESLTRGHALSVGDLDHDGDDDIVLGHSDKGTGDPAGPGVFVYRRPNHAEFRWEKLPVDVGGVATEDLTTEDFNGDGWLDIVACGRASHNVKVYINQGLKK